MKRFFLVISSFLLMLVSAAFAAKPTTISIMTFNIENGGAQVDFNKVVEAIRISGADVVGVQEACGNLHKLAKALHWKYVNTTLNIVSRLPLIEPTHSSHQYVLIEIARGKVVAMSNMHLPDEPYGPTMLSEGASVSAVLENERKVRLPSALPFLNEMASLAKKGMPVFLTGDFNSPSALDWTDKTLNLAPNHHQVVPWTVTKTAAELGLKDSFRTVHPDPIKTLGYTWPAGRPFLTNTIDNYNPSPDKDWHERIDYVLFGGPARALKSNIVAEAGSKYAALQVSPWPSDHAGVVSTFVVTPVKYQAKNRVSHG